MYKELERYEGEGGPYVIFSNVDERSFLDFSDPENDTLDKLVSAYNFTSSTVLLKMISRIHRAAESALQEIFLSWAQQQTSSLEDIAFNVRGSTREKRPDLSWTPSEIPPTRRTKWPIIVVEVVWSETRKMLINDMSFWLQDPDSRGDVNVALSMTVKRRGLITVER